MNNSSVFFLNPLSKHKKGQKKWHVIADSSFKKQYITDCSKVISDIQNTTAQTVVAVGGDGTINLVLNGALLSNPKKKLGVLYAGTSPDFCKFHNIPLDEKEALEVIQKEKAQSVDVLHCQEKDLYFASSCNIGLGVRVATLSNKIRKYFGDFLGTFIAALYAIIIAKKFSVSLKMDNKEFKLDSVYHLIILKNPFIASGLKLNADIQPDDGFLYTVAIKKNLIRSLLSLYRGKIPENAFINKGKKVYVSTHPALQLEWDGDAQNITTPVTIECKQKFLELLTCKNMI